MHVQIFFTSGRLDISIDPGTGTPSPGTSSGSPNSVSVISICCSLPLFFLSLLYSSRCSAHRVGMRTNRSNLELRINTNLQLAQATTWCQSTNNALSPARLSGSTILSSPTVDISSAIVHSRNWSPTSSRRCLPNLCSNQLLLNKQEISTRHLFSRRLIVLRQ